MPLLPSTVQAQPPSQQPHHTMSNQTTAQGHPAVKVSHPARLTFARASSAAAFAALSISAAILTLAILEASLCRYSSVSANGEANGRLVSVR